MRQHIPTHSCFSEKNHQVYVGGRLQGRTKKYSSEHETVLVSKKEFLRCFKKVAESKFDGFTYAECKMLSVNYNEKWRQLKTIIGQWTEKDANLNNFK